MSAPIHSTEDILAALRQHPEWRKAVWKALLADEQEAAEIRKNLLTDDLLKLPARFEKAEEERKEDQKKVWEGIRETNATLKLFVESTEKRSAEVDAHLNRLESTLQAFIETTDKRFAEVDARLNRLESTLQAFIETTDKRFAEVDARLNRLESTLQAFMETTDKRFAEVDARLNRLESTLQAFMETTDKRFAALEKTLDDMGIELNNNSGKLLEINVERKLDGYLCDVMGTSAAIENRVWSAAANLAVDAGVITKGERREINAADVLAAGTDTQTKRPVCAIVEVSKTVHTRDVDKADRRAKLLLKVMQAAVGASPATFGNLFPAPPVKSFAVVVGRTISDHARREAERKGVVFVQEEGGYDWEDR